MIRGISIALAAAALAALAAPAALAGSSTAELPHVTMGMGEQNPGMFDDARFLDTGIRHARLILPYDVVKAAFRQLYRPRLTIFAAILEFEKAVRGSG